MDKKEFFEKNDSRFLPLGFKKLDNDDPEFFYQYDLIKEDVAKEFDLNEDEVPCLLVGQTASNSGICLFTGSHFVWIGVNDPKEVIEWSNRILSFESA